MRREDQDKINKFSRLHQRELNLEAQLIVKNVLFYFLLIKRALLTLVSHNRKKKKNSTISTLNWNLQMKMRVCREYGPKLARDSPINEATCRYKIGDAFFQVSLSQAQGMLGISTAKLEEDITEVEDSLGTIREEMTQLKVELYARFGRSINLET